MSWVGVHWQAENVTLIPLSAHERILRDACREFSLTKVQLLGEGRRRTMIEARVYCIRRMREELGYSSVRIGNIMRRDHTTVLWHLLKGSIA